MKNLFCWNALLSLGPLHCSYLANGFNTIHIAIYDILLQHRATCIQACIYKQKKMNTLYKNVIPQIGVAKSTLWTSASPPPKLPLQFHTVILESLHTSGRTCTVSSACVVFCFFAWAFHEWENARLQLGLERSKHHPFGFTVSITFWNCKVQHLGFAKLEKCQPHWGAWPNNCKLHFWGGSNQNGHCMSPPGATSSVTSASCSAFSSFGESCRAWQMKNVKACRNKKRNDTECNYSWLLSKTVYYNILYNTIYIYKCK